MVVSLHLRTGKGWARSALMSCDESRGSYGKTMLDAVLSITVLAAILLVAGAYFMWRRTGNV
ncbi:MAG: hypothetical protein IH827_04985, partial [Myxococcales bacterium]|nr:hypothetical protein [Myxococcales bacterium]